MNKISVNKSSSTGLAFGKLFRFMRPDLSLDQRLISSEEVEEEKARFDNGCEKALQRIQFLAEKNEVFEAHLEILNDPVLRGGVFSKIEKEGKNAELALKEVEDEICLLFSELEDSYLKQRDSDIRDVCSQVMKIMKGINDNPLDHVEGGVVVLAEDLVPSDTVSMDFGKVNGVITKFGNYMSHVGIISRSKGIPAVLGLGDDYDVLRDGDFVILDCMDDKIIVNPDNYLLKSYKVKASRFRKEAEHIRQELQLGVKTTDGHKLDVMANAGSVDEVERAIQHGAMGIGLFRSELLFMQSKSYFPDEETQFKAYKDAAEACGGKTFIIRTLDIGGDKPLSYFPIRGEANPFLGWRAIRISLDRPDIFRVQLRALLRASAFGPLKIMFPMIISLDEFNAAKSVVASCQDELREEGLSFNEKIELGVMIETPAAVMLAEELAQNADFFSIGTNDLVQYTLAIDRTNQRVSQIGTPFHPAIIRSLKIVIDAAQKFGKPVGMCGEMAGNIDVTKLLVGMGLTELSVAIPNIIGVKRQVVKCSYSSAQAFAKEVYSMSSSADIREIIATNIDK